MQECLGEQIPERWRPAWRAMKEASSKPIGAEPLTPLEPWLEEVYDFDGKRQPDFAPADITKIGELVRRLLRFEPAERASAREILQDLWFQDE